MIKYLLGAILALAIIGNAFDFESDDYSWKIIINKEDVFYSVKNGVKNIFNMARNLFSDSELSDSSSIILEED